jgi:NADPH-dependent 2,4-dienoyl-CoA reductase/sulfur reductase-like enzyme
MSMIHHSYLIAGGGMAAVAAVRGIREADTRRPIRVIGEEGDPRYNRPPLSKGLWKGDSIYSDLFDMDYERETALDGDGAEAVRLYQALEESVAEDEDVLAAMQRFPEA